MSCPSRQSQMSSGKLSRRLVQCRGLPLAHQCPRVDLEPEQVNYGAPPLHLVGFFLRKGSYNVTTHNEMKRGYWWYGDFPTRYLVDESFFKRHRSQARILLLGYTGKVRSKELHNVKFDR